MCRKVIFCQNNIAETTTPFLLLWKHIFAVLNLYSLEDRPFNYSAKGSMKW